MYLKNDSSPKSIYAILVNASDGSPITSGVAVYHIQGTTRTAGAGTLTHIANGRWAYVPTQAETNYDAFAIDFYHDDAVGKGALVEIVTANQGLAIITADTSAIKQQTDKLNFTGEPGYELVLASAAVDVDEQAIADAVVAEIQDQNLVQVVVQPLVANVQRTDGDGGTITLWRYARLKASWTLDEDVSGHDLALIVYRPDTGVRLAECDGDDITITPQSTGCLVAVNAPDSLVPSAGVYAYVLRDLTTDSVLLSGQCIVKEAPDVAD